MSKLLGYATADWHVPERRGGGQWSSFPEVSGDSLHALRQIVDLCRSADVPLFAAGDLIDGPDPDPETISSLYEIIRDLTRSVYYVLGNHERNRDWLAPLGTSLARRLDDRSFSFSDGVTVSGISCVNGEKVFLAKVRESGSTTTIGLYHQQWHEFLKPGKYRVSDLPVHDLAICGDVHVRQVITPVAGPKLAVSPGPLAPQSAAEVQPHATYAIYRNPDLSISVETVPLQGRTYLTLDVDSELSAHNAMVAIRAFDVDVTRPKFTPLVNVRLLRDDGGFRESILKIAESCGVLVRFYGKPTGNRNSKTVPVRSFGTLAAVIESSDVPPDVKKLALMITARDANPREILAKERAAHELKPTELKDVSLLHEAEER